MVLILLIIVSVTLGMYVYRLVKLTDKNKVKLSTTRSDLSNLKDTVLEDVQGSIEKVDKDLQMQKLANEVKDTADDKELRSRSLLLDDQARATYGGEADIHGENDVKTLNFTNKDISEYIPIAAKSVWAKNGMSVKGNACFDTGVGEVSKNPDEGRICMARYSEGLDIVGKRLSNDESDQERVVRIHDSLRSKQVHADEKLYVHDGKTRFDPVNKDNRVLGDLGLVGRLAVYPDEDAQNNNGESSVAFHGDDGSGGGGEADVWRISAQNNETYAGKRDMVVEQGDWRPLVMLPEGPANSVDARPRIELRGDVVICDRDGNGCKHLVGVEDSDV